MQYIWWMTMKTATLPPLRVDPVLRKAVEDVLQSDETLSQFAEKAIRSQVELRQAQAEFNAQGLASRDKAKQTGIYVSAKEVGQRLHKALDQAKKARKWNQAIPSVLRLKQQMI